jgi:hypothetical protein
MLMALVDCLVVMVMILVNGLVDGHLESMMEQREQTPESKYVDNDGLREDQISLLSFTSGGDCLFIVYVSKRSLVLLPTLILR